VLKNNRLHDTFSCTQNKLPITDKKMIRIKQKFIHNKITINSIKHKQKYPHKNRTHH